MQHLAVVWSIEKQMYTDVRVELCMPKCLVLGHGLAAPLKGVKSPQQPTLHK